MTDEEWEQLKPFAEAKARARAALEAYKHSNQPTSLKDQIELEMAMERARIEFAKAEFELREATLRVGYKNV